MKSCKCCKRNKESTGMFGDITKEMEAMFYSHNGLSLVAVVDAKGTIISYMANFCDNTVIIKEEKSIKEKTLKAITEAIAIKRQSNECAKIMGFEYSSCFFLKRSTSTLIIYEFVPNVELVLIFEMDSLDSLFFNPNKYITTNESTLVALIKKFADKPK